MQISNPFVWGVIGGASLEVLHWWLIVNKKPDESFQKNPVYWVATLAMILVSGFLTQAYFSNGPFSQVAAFHVGFSTPFLLQAATKKAAGNFAAGRRNARGLIEPAWVKWLDW